MKKEQAVRIRWGRTKVFGGSYRNPQRIEARDDVPHPDPPGRKASVEANALRGPARRARRIRTPARAVRETYKRVGTWRRRPL